MRLIVLLFLFLVGLTPCNSQINIKITDKYKNIIEQADTLKKYYEKVINSIEDERMKYEKCFFEAFPSSFNRMRELYGFDKIKGAAPLYNYPTGEDHINLFSNLKYIDTVEYYNKYINISIGGKWEADNIREGFGIYGKIYDDTERMLNVLLTHMEKEIRSVFYFIFDGPHPDDPSIKKSYEELYNKIKPINPRVADLMKQAYEQLLAEDDGHGH